MKYALKSGRIAGEVAAKALKEGDISEGRLMEYEDLWRGNFGEELKIGSILLDSLEASPDKRRDSLFEILKEDPQLKEALVNVFLAQDLSGSVERLFENEDCRRIFGEEAAKKLFEIVG